MTLKQSIGIGIVVLGFLAMAALVYLLFFGGSAEITDINTEDPTLTQPEVIQPETIDANEPVVINPIENMSESDIATAQEPAVFDPETVSKQDLSRMAISFAERFGSYSNQSNFSNINDLRIFMTDGMKKWADGFIAEQAVKPAVDIYYGITTRAVATEIESYDDEGQAVILVKTRRREASGTTSNYSNTFNQDIKITFAKVDNSWKIDSAYWQE